MPTMNSGRRRPTTTLRGSQVFPSVPPGSESQVVLSSRKWLSQLITEIATNRRPLLRPVPPSPTTSVTVATPSACSCPSTSLLIRAPFPQIHSHASSLNTPSAARISQKLYAVTYQTSEESRPSTSPSAKSSASSPSSLVKSSPPRVLFE